MYENCVEQVSSFEVMAACSDLVFWRQESAEPHNPYDQELRELTSIEQGDVFIQRIEEMTDAVVVNTMIRQFEMEYTKEVARIRMQNEKKSKEMHSIWVEECKSYIFRHLHEKIRVQEIAKSLHLNSSYLSDLFKQQESITLTDFILNEKVKLAKNLLIYSPYSYIEIATYLGFSSQSHLTKIFLFCHYLSLFCHFFLYSSWRIIFNAVDIFHVCSPLPYFASITSSAILISALLYFTLLHSHQMA